MTRLLIIGLMLLLPVGCARLPVEKLEAARSSVARAYSGGAVDYAPGKYQLATSALAAAEKLIASGEYRQAERTLDLASSYAGEALQLSSAQLQRIAQEQAQLAEQLRQAELERQRELVAEQQAKLEAEREEQQRRLAAAKLAAAAEAAATAAVGDAGEGGTGSGFGEKEAAAHQSPELVDLVEVAVGENLAMVAARPEVYSEAGLWPLIYKANRDQITTPRQIFSGQVLVVPRDKSSAELEAARREAAEFGEF